MSGKELKTCDLCDARTAKHVLSSARGVRLAVCASCAVEVRRDGVDLQESSPEEAALFGVAGKAMVVGV